MAEEVTDGYGHDVGARITGILTPPEEFSEDIFAICMDIISCLDSGMSVAFAYDYEILFVRIYDGERYIFPLPFMLTDSADLCRACLDLSLYARREMIPLIISDIPREELPVLQELFPHIDANCYGEDEDSFIVKVNSECDMLEEMPTYEMGDIRLDRILPADIEQYAALCRNRDLNRYWGYDADVDNPSGDEQYYLDVAEREFFDGVAVTLAIRYRGKFVGEAVIYDFDYLGGAQIAVRVLPEFHGLGVGKSSVKSLIELSRSIGLKKVYAEILEENVASIKMTSSVMGDGIRDKGKVKFAFSL